LLCDEPTSALDASLAASMLNLLGRLRRELGIAIVFVTHDLGVARLVADRVAIMYLGRIVEDLPAADLAAVRHPYARMLLSAVPGETDGDGPIGERTVARGEPASPLDPPPGCAFHPRCPDATPACSAREPAFVELGPRHHIDCLVAGGR
jgi:oligopeptide/dipeptide ABC transporter ATP-binding protein